jgi:hypothetical protein
MAVSIFSFQDTPFWKKQGRWSRPLAAASSKSRSPVQQQQQQQQQPVALEEAWYNHHSPSSTGLTMANCWSPINSHVGGGGGGGGAAIHSPMMMTKNIFNYPSVPVYLPPAHLVTAGSHGSTQPLPSALPHEAAADSDISLHRLEITELSDREFDSEAALYDEHCQSSDYSAQMPNSDRTGRNIFEMSSGLY